MPVRLLLLLALLLTAKASHGQNRTIAVANMPALGVGGGAVFYQFSKSASGAQTSLNDEGHTALLGRMLGGTGGVTTATDTGIWSDGGGSLALLAREGGQAPGVPAGGVFSEFTRDPVLNDAGQIAFPALLREGIGDVTAADSGGIWSQRNGQVQLVVRTGGQAPGTPAGANFGSFAANNQGDGFFGFNNLGHTTFTANLALSGGLVTAANDTGIWSDISGSLALVAREGDLAPGAQPPGAPAGAVFDDLTSPSESPVLDHNGQLAFTAQLRVGSGGVVTGNDFGIWIADKDRVTLAVRESAAAPTPTGATFRHFNEVQINDAGSLLFRALLNPGAGGVTANDDESIWVRRDGNLEMIAQEGSQVPGAATGFKYGSFSSYALGKHERAAISGYLLRDSGGVTADNNAVIWGGASNTLRIVAREGDAAPGSSGAAFSDAFFTPNINRFGQIAFMAILKAGVGGVNSSNDRGVWATDPTGALRLIAREGDQIEVTPGDFQTITELGFRGNSGNADGRFSMFNDRGEVQFWARLGSTEGVFISQLVKAARSLADFNEDGIVSNSDLQSWSAGYGDTSQVTQQDGDANGDLTVDGADFLAWQTHLTGSGVVGAAMSIPEPAGPILALWALAI